MSFSRSSASFLALFATAAGAALLAIGPGCAQVTTPAGGGGGRSGVPGTGGGSGPGPGSGGRPGTGQDGGLVVSNPDGGGNFCQMASYTFAPMIPTVFVLVDRSGSMFNCLEDPNPNQNRPCPDQTKVAWVPLRTGVLNVIQALQTEVRFGFGAFTGVKGGMCPIIEPVAAKLNNYDDISTRYNALQPPRELMPGTWEKWETPTTATLQMVGAMLAADTSPGAKYILFVTDGEPDYCGDGNPICAPDSVVGQLQKLKMANNITTIVLGIQSPFSSLPVGTLQAFANAGAGEPVKFAPPMNQAGLDTNSIWDQCHNGTGNPSDAENFWKAELAASGKPDVRGTTLGTYSSPDAGPGFGPTRPFTPTVTDQAQLLSQLQQALAGVKSCTFDLGNIEGKSIRVNLNELARAHVVVEGRDVPLSDTNGWKMTTDRQLDLVGTACTDWRKPENDTIDFQFPCEIIVID